MEFKEILELHEKGKIEIGIKTRCDCKEDLGKIYTPGVGEVCEKIKENKDYSYDYTFKGNSVAIISDGSAVLGLGNIGPEASIPVLEGKAVLFKKFGNANAVPIALATQDTEEIIKIVKALEPCFGGINLEDISAPRCFEIEKRLIEEMEIPVFHDDQHGTAIVVLAGIINSLKIVNKNIEEIKIVINGAGAAGTAIANLLLDYGAKDIIVLDSKGAMYEGREEFNKFKKELSTKTNLKKEKGFLEDVLDNADVFIGVSKGNILTKEMIKKMNSEAIVFALANPVPEIIPNLAKEAGARIVATGRSDFPNQINNALVFPGLFRGLLDSRKKDISKEMKIECAKVLASVVKDLNEESIIPNLFDKEVYLKIAEAVKTF